MTRRRDVRRFGPGVTLLAGDNGTGKSTLVEAIAEAIGFAPEGGELERSGELPPVPRAVLGGALEPALSRTKPRNGYFLRAESFFNVAQFVDGNSTFAPDLSLYGDVPLHQQSHGQSFLALASNRFSREGIYILDEPEAAPSTARGTGGSSPERSSSPPSGANPIASAIASTSVDLPVPLSPASSVTPGPKRRTSRRRVMP